MIFNNDDLAVSDCCLRGNKEQLKSIYKIMRDILDSRGPIREGVGYRNNPKNVVLELGEEDEDNLYWGVYYGLSISDDFTVLKISLQTYGKGPEDFLDFLKYKFPGIEAYFLCTVQFTGPFYTNDRAGVFFPNRYVVDLDGVDDKHYFSTRQKAVEYIESLIGRKVEPDEDLQWAVFKWSEFLDDIATYYEYEIID